ncbi:LCP family protein [Mangrovibacillus sp. Mu-81]|uniref:LCP family protein n=1 Tax=Mangrovibacillus sp. Mu-81 TaxID=3121478 RepID=UPI002FE4D304
MEEYNNSKLRYKRTLRKKRRRRVFFTVIMFFLILTISAFSVMAYKSISALDSTYQEISRGDKSKLRDEKVEITNDPFSILILGVEDYSDKNDKGRSDTLMVATLDPKDQSMKLVSIPRDTLVSIPEYGEDKINHSYAYGGKELVIETVEDYLDLPIDYYVTVNFDGFKEIIDEVGGVDVNVPFDFSDINNKREEFHFYEGMQKLNGEEALVYARMRKQDPRGDFGRNERQRQIVTGLLDKVLSPNTFLKVDDIANVVGDNIQTNMKVKEGLGLLQKFSGFSTSSIQQIEFTGEDQYYDNVYYFKPSEESLNEITSELQSHLDYSKNETN